MPDCVMQCTSSCVGSHVWNCKGWNIALQVSAALREGRPVEPESFDCVTIFFSDIVGFETMSTELPPQEVRQITMEMIKSSCDRVHTVVIRWCLIMCDACSTVTIQLWMKHCPYCCGLS